MDKRQHPPVSVETRRRGARAMGELLPGLGLATFRRFGFVQNAIVTRWAEIVGPQFARHSLPEGLRFPAGRRRGGTLGVLIDGAFAPSFQHAGPAIIERINRFFGYGAVDRLALRHGLRSTGAERAPAAPPPPPPAELLGGLATIADPALREALARLAAEVAATSGPPRFD